MFSIHFNICFLMILNICHCHFGGNTYENCTKKINVIPKNGDKAKIVVKNDTTEENHGKNVANTSVGIDRKGIKLITKYNRVIEEVSNDNKNEDKEELKVEEKKGVILFDLDNTDNNKTNISLNSSEVYKKKSEDMIDIKELNVTKKADAEKLSNKIINGNLTEIIRNHTDKYGQKYDLSKNDKNHNLRKNNKNETRAENVNNLLQNNSKNQNVQRYYLSKNENNNLRKNLKNQTMSANRTNFIELIDLHKNGKNETMNENVTKIFEKKSTDHNVQKYLPKKENNDLHKKGKTETITDNVNIILQNNGKAQKVEKYDMHKKFRSDTTLEKVTKFLEINSTDKNKQEYDLPENKNNDKHKNVQKRDIGIPEDKMPKVSQKKDATKYPNFNFNDKNENHDITKNIHNNNTIKKIKHYNTHIHKINDDNLYNYQNYEMNYKKIIDKNELNSKKHTGRFDDNFSHKIQPQIQTRLNNEIVKRSLDEFKIVRRKTHYTMPPIDLKNDVSLSNTDHYQGLVYNHDDKAERMNAKYNADSEYNTEYNQNNAYQTYDEKNYQSNEEPEMPHYKELNNLLTRQKEIVRQLAHIQLIGRNKDVAFYDLLEEVKAKQEDYKTWKNYTKFSFDKPTTASTTVKTTTAKPTTVVTQFDETEIRRALKNDPQIKRILKLANMKRKKYLDNVRNYLVSNKYAHDKEYAKKLAEQHSEVNKGKPVETTNLNNKV